MKKEKIMSVNSPQEMFVLLLSDVRRKTERSADFYQEASKIAEDPGIKEAIEARAFVAQKSLDKIDEVFKLINQKPVTLSGKTEEVFVEDFRREVAEIKTPLVRRIFVLSKLMHLTHWRIGEYMALIAAADATGNFGVGVILESCLGDYLAFVERNRRIIKKLIKIKAATKATA
jgi:ferritin-like metal-binding protein YciE